MDIWIGCGIEYPAFVPICMTNENVFVAYGESLKNLSAGNCCAGFINNDGGYSRDYLIMVPC